jgi:hypothetical protein
MPARAQIRSAPARSAAARRPWPWQNLWRQAGWGLAAAAALSIAVLSSRDEGATQKVAALLSSMNLGPPASVPHQFDAETAARQLAQAMRGLADDRDRLASRLSSVERDMRETTGLIKQQIEAAKAEAIKSARQAAPWPDSAQPVPMTIADVAVMVKTVSPASPSAAELPSSTAAATSAASPAPSNAADNAAPEATAALGQAYGVDLGAASTMKTLHHRWVSLRTAHPQLFEGIQPVVSVKQNPRTGHTELHLIVGPYANAETAAQFCDYVVPFHLSCQPAMFDGSRLALQ